MTVRMFPLVRSWMSGDSAFAVERTSSNPSDTVPENGTVPVTAPSKAYGTSTPGTLRPSARMYSTCTRLIVTSLFVVGPVVVLMLRGASRSVTVPGSPKIVGQGLSDVHGAGDVTFVITSEVSTPDGVPGCGPPRLPSSDSMIRYTGELPSRATSPHETPAAITAERTNNRAAFRLIMGSCLNS